MKLPDRLLAGAALFACAMTLAACATYAQESERPAAAASSATGPAADYPMVIGDPFEVDGVIHTPLDTMNYDRVGYLAAEAAATTGVTGSHRTLPLPSYVEVTSLETGRTILVRLERRGPMINDRLLALSPMAMSQLGAGEGAAIRMRRVNPPENHRAKLRVGEEAPLRMDTPEGLLTVLRRKLPDAGSVSLADPRQAEVSGLEPESVPILSIDPTPEPESGPTPEVGVAQAAPENADQPVPTETAVEGKFAIQLGAFSVRANAEKLAAEVGGFLVESGRFTIVRTGPYASRGQAADALAKLRAQGYSDALIRTLD